MYKDVQSMKFLNQFRNKAFHRSFLQEVSNKDDNLIENMKHVHIRQMNFWKI